MKNTGILNGLYRVSEWIMRFSITNILWLFFNLPLVFLFLFVKYGLHNSEVIQLLIPILIVAPFIFFPATTALFASVRDWTIKDDDNHLVKEYWRYYRENYKKSLFGGLILTLIWSGWLSNLFYYQHENTILFFAFCLFGVLLYVFTINFFSLISHYKITLMRLFRNSFLITIGKPMLSLIIFIINFIVIYGSVIGPLFFILFFSGSLLAFLSFSIFYRMYLNVITKASEE